MRPPLWLAIALNVLCMSVAADVSILTAVGHTAVLCLLASFGFVINDLHDRPIDAINGRLRLQALDDRSCRRLYVVATGLAGLALTLAAFMSSESFVMALSIAVGLVLYTHVFRPVLLVANVVASAMIIAPLWMPLATSTQRVPFALLAACLAAGILALSREFMLDAKDRAGDAEGNRCTIATRFGTRTAATISLLMLAVALPLVVAPAFWPSGLTGTAIWPLIVPAAAATVITAAFAARVLAARNASEIEIYVRVTRLAMLFYPLGLLLYV